MFKHLISAKDAINIYEQHKLPVNNELGSIKKINKTLNYINEKIKKSSKETKRYCFIHLENTPIFNKDFSKTTITENNENLKYIVKKLTQNGFIVDLLYKNTIDEDSGIDCIRIKW